MKRWIALCLCLLALPLTALADTAQERADRLWERIDPLLEEAGFVPGAYEHKGIVGDPDSGWHFSIWLPDHPEDDTGMYGFILTPDYELILERAPMKRTPEQQLYDAFLVSKGPESYLPFAELVEKWRDRVDELEFFDVWSTRFVTMDIRRPDAGAISYEAAVASANEALLALPGWTEDTLTHFVMEASVYLVPEDIGRPVWLFVYDKEVPFDGDMDAFNAALERLYSYTVNGEPEPVQFSVLIDAMDGTLVETPRFDYVPVQYVWSDFVIRTPEFLAK